MTTVLIIGAGPVGLINARTLLDDGFKVTIVTKEDGVGGLWRHTFPDLATNSPFGSFTFSGYDMAKPAHLDGSSVPARTYCRYLEDFFQHFIEKRASVRFRTSVSSLLPAEEAGWKAELVGADEVKRWEPFDKVVLATGSLGKPRIPPGLLHSHIPVYHTDDLTAEGVDRLLSTIPSSTSLPSLVGDAETVVVVGTGKSAIDAAMILARKQRKVIMLGRSFKWMCAPVKPDFIGSELLTALMGPSRELDSWTQWFMHCTTLGGALTSLIWKGLMRKWSSLYGSKLSPPITSCHLDMPRFSVGLTPEFRSYVEEGHILVVTGSTVVSSDEKGVRVTDSTGVSKHVRCSAIVSATGYDGDGRKFLDASLRIELGLTRQPMRVGWRDRVNEIRKGWKSFRPTRQIEDSDMGMPLVYRGIVPLGRYQEKDLVVAGGSTISYKPAIMYETESHWISSFLLEDPNLVLPSKEEALNVAHADNEFIRARYPDVDPYYLFPDGTYFSGFNDLTRSRLLLHDLSVDPWRAQRSPWYNPLGWINVAVHAQQYAQVGEERRRRLKAAKGKAD